VTRAATSVADLLARGLAAPEDAASLDAVVGQFSLSITPDLMALMPSGDAADPLARQFVPTPAEQAVDPRELPDPIGDHAHEPVKGVVHRYPDRVLLKPVQVCPVYCRFCFRREQVGRGNEGLTGSELGAALDYIRGHPEIWEVILTGGDPLVLSNRRLAALFAALQAIEHVQVIRVHTRYPVAEPKRITAALARAMRGRAAVYVVLHCNHPREFTAAARAACDRLVDAGIPMLSQSVLLRGVNDDVETMRQLMRMFVAARIKPYYLHHLDLARGTGHFRTSIAEGQALMRALRGTISGLCQPTYVLDIPGGHGKVPIGPEQAKGDAEACYQLEDFRGRRHVYRDPAASAARRSSGN